MATSAGDTKSSGPGLVCSPPGVVTDSVVPPPRLVGSLAVVVDSLGVSAGNWVGGWTGVHRLNPSVMPAGAYQRRACRSQRAPSFLASFFCR